MSQKYAAYDTSGNITGFYADDIQGKIPEPNIKITDKEWQDCLDHQGYRKIDTSNFKIVACEPTITQEQQISQINTEYAAKIDKLLKAKNLAEALGNSTALINQQVADTLAEQKQRIQVALNK